MSKQHKSNTSYILCFIFVVIVRPVVEINTLVLYNVMYNVMAYNNVNGEHSAPLLLKANVKYAENSSLTEETRAVE